MSHSLYWKVLGAFFLLSVVPLLAVELVVSLQMEDVKELASRTSQLYEHRAQRIAGRVSDFLHACEQDLRALARLPKTPVAFTDFANSHKRPVWIRAGSNAAIVDERTTALLYKEVSFIEPSGQERILVVRGRPVEPEQLRDVSEPSNTTYRCERYFLEAMKREQGEIYVSHLNGFHVNRIEQLGIERLIPQLKNKDEQAKSIYRFLLFEMLRAAGEVEYVNSFRSEQGNVLVYKAAGREPHILVQEPERVAPEELQARELELKQLIDSLAPEDVVEGQRYDGVFRFAMKVAQPDGSPAGVVALGLDHLHLSQFSQHIKAMEEDATVFAGYRDADYTYLFDDEGWIITHPKLWNIRGLEADGKRLVPAYTGKTSRSEVMVGRIPVNLLQLDWKMGQGYHAVVLETRAKRTGLATSNNLAGVLRTRVYSPILYDSGDYAKYGIFGGVMMGTRVDKFIVLLRKMNADIARETTRLRQSIYFPMLFVVLLVMGLAVLFAHGLTRPIRSLGEAARRIGSGQLDTAIPDLGRDEIGDLARSFAEMTRSLKESIGELERRNLELKQAQSKLLLAEKDKQRQLQREVDQLQKEVARASFANMVGQSPQIRKVQEEIVRVASSSATVLILGENGTGKELVAEAIHRNSPRRDREFVRVNCAAFNDNLLESELFGHAKGSYTGASSARKGLFETADGGTLLLDEVGDMSLEMQKKLLRTLQEGEVVPLGSSRVIEVDVRILAATNKDLQARMREGLFREDLYHRLNVIAIHVPPLRERKEDILLLAREFCQKFAAKEDRPLPFFSPEAERFLLEYRWPGNVRELENAIERAVIRSRSRNLRVDDFQLVMDERDLPCVLDGVEKSMTLAEVEKAYIMSVLEKHAGNKKAAAKDLAIGYNTLWRKLKKYQDEL
ncbi:MAG: sigma 54-interacting transcriptional regulator [Deltaproteobacteria bacterium]|nr:sigma 54-interacting transcriptional regulator [Deltaproteobacteria bacterium]